MDCAASVSAVGDLEADPVPLVALGGAGDHHGRDAEAFGAWEETMSSAPRDVPLLDDLTDAD